MRKTLKIIVIALFLFCLTGCTDQSLQMHITGHSFETEVDEPLMTHPEGIFLKVDLYIENTSDDPVEVSPGSFRVVVDRHEYKPSAIMTGSHWITPETINPGIIFEDSVFFDIPEKSDNFELHFKDEVVK